jgi:hypothetical protein
VGFWLREGESASKVCFFVKKQQKTFFTLGHRRFHQQGPNS